MEYKSYSTILFSINLFFLTAFIALFFVYGGNWYMAIVPFAIITIGLLVLKAPINRWGFKFQHVDIDDKLMNIVETEYPIVARYSHEEKLRFRQRMFHFLYDRESYLVVGEPEKLDLYHTILISAPAVIIGMNNSNFDRCEDINRIVAYKHAFPSPKLRFLHTAEYDHDDGVVIASIEHLMLSLREPNKYYHIAFHIWAERIVKLHGDALNFPQSFPLSTETIFGISQEKINDLLGIGGSDETMPEEKRNIDDRVFALVAFFTRARIMKEIHPQYFKEISEFLKKN